MDRGAWRATVHGVAKSQARLKPLKHAPDFLLLVSVFRERTQWTGDLKAIRR